MRIVLTMILFWLFGFQVEAQSTLLVVVRANEWSPALQAWKQFRRQQGFTVIEVEPGVDFATTRRQIEVAIRNRPSDKRYVFLLGDAPSFRDVQNGSRSALEIPTAYVDSKVVKNFGSEPTIATDFPYADLDQDGIPETIVGRFPANSFDQTKTYLQRVLDYENRSHRGAWQREIDIVAGVGNLGFVGDTVVQALTKKLLTEHIPPTFQLSLTHASTNSLYCPPLERFRENVLRRFNDGCLFWIYLGHGHPTHLDSIRIGQSNEPILNEKQISLVNISDGSPIAVCLACYLGAFDVPCFAEQLLKQTNGPIAAIAASRVTTPYGMATLGNEMLRQCFVERRLCVGEILHFAKQSILSDEQDSKSKVYGEPSEMTFRQAMDNMAKALSPTDHSIVQERQEHVWLFNLLGDPTLTIRQPNMMEIQAPESIQAGEPLEIRGISPFPGTLQVELTYPRTRVPPAVRKLQLAKVSEEGDQNKQMIYEAANQLVCVKTEKVVAGGRFEMQLPTDTSLRGNFEVHAMVYGSNQWASASQTIELRKVSN